MKIKKLCIANRGEIAVRIIRCCRELGVRSVALYSEADREALHVKLADEAYCIGPAESAASYLSIDNVIDAAVKAQCDAVHPGYGFLSENAEFARRVIDAGIIFIGPEPDTIVAMGDKTSARDIAEAAGIPVVPGYDGSLDNPKHAKSVAAKIGYPLIIKAAHGGGGRGMRIVTDSDSLVPAVKAAIMESKLCFGTTEIFMEKYIQNAKHVEIQVLGDGNGHVVHLGERDCSAQRRHQKLIEESPCSTLSDSVRKKIIAAAVKLAQSVKYRGAGTVEFLYDGNKSFYFLEMNTRLQVEHPVTEMVTGVDLVAEQIRIASGEVISFEQKDVVVRGYAIECRINAEDENFMPSVGTVKYCYFPEGFGVRNDSACFSGFEVPRFYDSMISKVIVWADTREKAIQRMQRALMELKIEGIKTTASFHKQFLMTEEFTSGDYYTNFIDSTFKRGSVEFSENEQKAAAIVASLLRFRDETKKRSNLSKVKKMLNRWSLAARHDTFRSRRGF